MFYRLVVFSNSYMSNKDKKLYIDKLFPLEATYSKYSERNIGVISKFNNSVGFKDVVSYEDNFNRITPPKVKSPKEYIPPEQLLYEGLFISLRDNEVMTFTVDDKFIDHPIKEFSYKTIDILVKFKNFLDKIFPKLAVKIEVLENKPYITEKEFVLSHFALNLHNSIHYTIEVSLNRLLTENEVEEIVYQLQSIYPLNLNIRQHYCETCVEYSNGLSPYHIELEYL